MGLWFLTLTIISTFTNALAAEGLRAPVLSMLNQSPALRAERILSKGTSRP